MRSRQLVAAGAIVVAAATVAVAVAVNDPDQTPAPGTLGGAPRAAAAAAGPQPPSPASLAAEDRLRRAAGGRLTITRGPNGLARLVGTTPGHPVALPGGISPAAPAPVQALAHLMPIGALFGLFDIARELEVRDPPGELVPAPGEDRVVRFQQRRDGRRVLAGELAVVLDQDGALRSITAETLASSPDPSPGLSSPDPSSPQPSPDLSTSPDPSPGLSSSPDPSSPEPSPDLSSPDPSAGLSSPDPSPGLSSPAPSPERASRGGARPAADVDAAQAREIALAVAARAHPGADVAPCGPAHPNPGTSTRA